MGRSDGDSYEFVQGHMWLNSFDMRLTFNGSRQRNPSARERCSEEQGRRKSGTAKISKFVFFDDEDDYLNTNYSGRDE